MARNRLKLLYQLLQSQATWNMHWWQSIEEASVAFENIGNISEQSPLPPWFERMLFLLIYSHLYTWLHA